MHCYRIRLPRAAFRSLAVRPFVSLTGVLAVLLTTGGLAHRAQAQAMPTARLAGDLQVGGGYADASSDYVKDRITGPAVYATFDFATHFGVEVDFRRMTDPHSDLYEKNYEVGGRYVLPVGALHPYIKGLYGRGVLNYPYDNGNLAYNMLVGGAGVDIAVQRHINVRVDAEYQRWSAGPGIPNGLTPVVFTAGVAYHFGSRKLQRLVD